MAISEKQHKQRRQAARKHGVYSIRDHGPKAMTSQQRGKYAELTDQLQTKQGTIEALRDAAVNTVILAQVAQNYVVEQHKQGKSLDQIALLKSLPAFWNSAGRALKLYYETLSKGGEDIIDAAQVLKDIRDGQEDA